MKLVSSTPKSRHIPPQPPKRGGFLSLSLKRLKRSRLFSTRAAWWVLVVVVAIFAISIFRLLRHAIETALAQ